MATRGGSRKGKGKYNAHVAVEEEFEDAAYLAEEANEPYADPAHWSADEDADEEPDAGDWEEFP